MEKLLFTLLPLVLISCAGSKQTAGINDIAAPPNTNTITIHTQMDSEAAYRKTAQVLQSRGYTFRSTDETLKSISTEFTGAAKRYGVDNTFVRVGANIQGDAKSKIVIRGWYKTLENEGTETGQRVKKFGQNGSPVRNAWKELYEVANSLGDSLSYQNQ